MPDDDPTKAETYSVLVDLVKHQNDNMQRWADRLVTVQVALMTAAGALVAFRWPNPGPAQIVALWLVGLFAIAIAIVFIWIIWRNRAYLTRYIKQVIEIHPGRPWTKRGEEKGPGVRGSFVALGGCLTFLWLAFLVLVTCFRGG